MHELLRLINLLEDQITMNDKENNTISSAKTGWHIQHSLLVINSIVNALKQSNPANYHWKFNLNRVFIFTINKIPRGKGKAPKAVQPKAEITHNVLHESVALAKINVHLLGSLHKNQYFLHPYFGHLNVKSTVKFLKIHTKHHLKIINDILKA